MKLTAQSFLMAAAGHAASAEILRNAGKHNPDNGLYSVSMWFLMGWATELALKAAILHCGGSEADCRDVNHDLNAALSAAISRGYSSALTNLPNLVRDLSISHQTYFFRYMPEGNTQVPGDSALALAVLKALILEVGSQIGLGDVAHTSAGHAD